MKRILSVVMTIICLFSLVPSPVSADGTWHCEICDTDRDSAFCPVCGARRPDGSYTDDEPGYWICPTCGRELLTEYQFCPDDGTKQAIGHGPWPVRDMEGTGTALKKLQDENQRHQSWFGPNEKSYPGAGAYKPNRVSAATALFREGSFVLVDLEYTTVGRRCVYFRVSSLTGDDADTVELKAYPAVVTAGTQPAFGPGSEYDSVVEKVADDYTGETLTMSVTVPAGTSLKVFFESRDWVFAEFTTSLGLIRAWLPASSVAGQ